MHFFHFVFLYYNVTHPTSMDIYTRKKNRTKATDTFFSSSKKSPFCPFFLFFCWLHIHFECHFCHALQYTHTRKHIHSKKKKFRGITHHHSFERLIESSENLDSQKKKCGHNQSAYVPTRACIIGFVIFFFHIFFAL